jgi:predicted small secreted protein
MKTLIALIATLFVVAGCNTIEGIGKDVKKAGSTVEDAAKKK